jgi:hypothetical protein
MIPRLKEIDVVVSDDVRKAVLLVDSPRPDAFLSLERFWLPFSCKWIPQRQLDQFQNPGGSTRTHLNPVL